MDNQKMKWETVFRSKKFEDANERRNDIKKDGRTVKVHLQDNEFRVKVGTPVEKKENIKEVETDKV